MQVTPVFRLGINACALLLVSSFATLRVQAQGAPTPPTAEKKSAEASAPPSVLNYSGSVRNKLTGKPIEGAKVTVRRSILRDQSNKVLEETRHVTDPAGKYAFTIPPEQVAEKALYIELDVEHPEHAPRRRFGYALSMIQKNDRLGARPFFDNVELWPAEAVIGVVQTPDGKPASGIKVRSYSNIQQRAGAPFEYGSFDESTTDNDGRFRLLMITPGDGILWIEPEADYAPSSHVVMEKRGDLGVFQLKTGVTIKGIVLDSSEQPVPGVPVEVEYNGPAAQRFPHRISSGLQRRAISNANGEFTMAPLPPGPAEYEIEPKMRRVEAAADGSWIQHIVPHVFVNYEVNLKEGEEPGLLVIRALPHVVVKAQYYDSKGQPRTGHAPMIHGSTHNNHARFFTKCDISDDGKITVLAPREMTKTQIDLVTNEHSALRYRLGPDEPLQRGDIELGTLIGDVTNIEIIRYTAPIVLVTVKTKDGSQPKDVSVKAVYSREQDPPPDGVARPKRDSDVSFERQEDGRFRTEQLLPDEETVFTAQAAGYRPVSQTMQVSEGQSQEITLLLEKPAESAK